MNYSKDQEGQEVGNELSQSKSLGSHAIDIHNLVAKNWVQKARGEEVCEGWDPEFMVAIEEPTVCVANSPEVESW